MSVSFGYQLMFFPSASCQLYDCGAGHWYCRLVLFLSNYQSQANFPISYVMIKKDILISAMTIDTHHILVDSRI